MLPHFGSGLQPPPPPNTNSTLSPPLPYSLCRTHSSVAERGMFSGMAVSPRCRQSTMSLTHSHSTGQSVTSSSHCARRVISSPAAMHIGIRVGKHVHRCYHAIYVLVGDYTVRSGVIIIISGPSCGSQDQQTGLPHFQVGFPSF